MYLNRLLQGDNLMTAMSVARDCHMIPETDKIITVTAMTPDHDVPAQLKFEYAETPSMSHSSSIVSTAISVLGDTSPMVRFFYFFANCILLIVKFTYHRNE